MFSGGIDKQHRIVMGEIPELQEFNIKVGITSEI